MGALDSLLSWAKAQIGKPYSGPLSAIGGGRNGDPGFDCSSFVANAFRQLGLSIPAYTDSAYSSTVSTSDPKPGDVIFYRYLDPSQPGTQFPHMGIYLGGNQMLDAQFSKGVGIHPLLNRPYEIRHVPGFDNANGIIGAIGAIGSAIGNAGGTQITGVFSIISTLSNFAINPMSILTDPNAATIIVFAIGITFLFLGLLGIGAQQVIEVLAN